MNLCSDGHQEVCFEGKNCPACTAIYERDQANQEVELLKDKAEQLQSRIDDLELGAAAQEVSSEGGAV